MILIYHRDDKKIAWLEIESSGQAEAIGSIEELVKEFEEKFLMEGFKVTFDGTQTRPDTVIDLASLFLAMNLCLQKRPDQTSLEFSKLLSEKSKGKVHILKEALAHYYISYIDKNKSLLDYCRATKELMMKMALDPQFAYVIEKDGELKKLFAIAARW